MPAVRQYNASPIGEHVFLADVTQVLIDALGGGGGRSLQGLPSGTLPDEVSVLDEVSGKRIAMAPAVLRAKYRKERRPCLS
jgi:hypothetical protein